MATCSVLVPRNAYKHAASWLIGTCLLSALSMPKMSAKHKTRKRAVAHVALECGTCLSSYCVLANGSIPSEGMREDGYHYIDALCHSTDRKSDHHHTFI